jgi:4-amino-4-deoxy-L-arabinose transferase-like glycosyltransferase
MAIGSLVLVLILVAPFATPYWWDEGAVYVPGAKWVAEHGFDARPGVFPDEFSRGHTPLFFLILAGVFRFVGPGPVGGHVIALFFGWLTLLFTYALAKEVAGTLAGVVATALLLVAPLFLTMSSEALPEAALTALTAATFWGFARGRMAWCAALGTLLVLTKETGIACPLAIAGAIGLEAVTSGEARERYRDALRRASVALVPGLALAAFFLYQRAATGWFVLPYHVDLFNAAHSLVDQLGRVVVSIFIVDGRVVALAAAAGVLLWRRGKAFTGPQRPVVTALALHALANVAFFTKMSFLDRYTLCVHMDFAVVLAVLFVPESAQARWRALGLSVVAVTMAIALGCRDAGTDLASGETTFRYLHAVHANQALYAKLEAEGGEPAILTQWPITDELRDPYLGWVTRPFRAFDIAYRKPSSPPFQRVIAMQGLSSYDALVTEARKVGFHVHESASEKIAAIELWGP